MFRSYALSYRLHRLLTKAPNTRWLSFLNPNSPSEKQRLSETQKTIHPITFESLYVILDSRSTFVRPWKNHNDDTINFAVIESDGLVSPEPVQVQLSRKTRDPDPSFTQVDNGLVMDVKGRSLHDFLETCVGRRGIYVLGREDSSPFQPHMWEIPKGIAVPPSLRLTNWRRKSEPDWNARTILGPAFPMSLDCLNQNLEEFMQDCGRVTPLRHWFTPEEEFCKEAPYTLDFMRDHEAWLKSEGIYDEELDEGLE